jgi:hypothetical protein
MILVSGDAVITVHPSESCDTSAWREKEKKVTINIKEILNAFKKISQIVFIYTNKDMK